MNGEYIFFPDAAKRQNTDNEFNWTVNGSPVVITAEQTVFGHLTHEKLWLFMGSVGHTSQRNLFAFQFFIPYIDENPIDTIYELGSLFKYHHSIAGPAGQPGIRVVSAVRAELAIKLNPAEGTASGTFNATFSGEYSALHPQGSFTLIKDR
ncbi:MULTISPECIES: hypothetical protein [Pseudomonas]|uniref:hypothetical protein n=1 Tax=Pseudomonas TaxID=286 RepID=UPI000518ECFA|nr:MULTISPECIES: hypothetical protein [Pseudomonas]QOY70181.1 hypothetical protein IH404_20645 [Pseudomonas sp. OST1909]WPN50237.1 hypothetical protein QMK52_15035 [Pseudomonas sp. P9_2]